MKRVIYLIMLVLSLTFLFSCSNLKQVTDKDTSSEENSNNPEDKETDDKDEENSTYGIKDYYPFLENQVYNYLGSGNEYASYTVWVDYINKDRVQIRKNNGGTEMVTVLENKDGELRSVLSKEEIYYRENFTTKEGAIEEVYLKEPLIKGNSWTLTDGSKRYISNTKVDINTAVGDFKTLEVTTEGKDYKKLEYYALNTGLVKTVFTSQGTEVSSTLNKIQKDTPFIQNVRFYYPTGIDMKLYYVEKKLSFKTNDITKMTFEKLFKESPKEGMGELIGPSVKIKSLYLNKDVVYVDFSKELASEMNAGTSYEFSILQGITNTIGQYYNFDKVYITIEGEPYSSGHILMKKGETFTVDLKNSEKFK